MIIDARSITPLSPTPELSTWSNGKFRLTWRGSLFVPGHRTGSASAKAFVDLVVAGGLRAALIQTFGQFLAVLVDLKTAERRVFVDSGGIFKAFANNDWVSSSYLELVNRSHLRRADFCLDKAAEFLQFGFLISTKTLTHSIRLLNGGEVIRFANNGMTVEHLEMPGLDDANAPLMHLEELFPILASVLEDESVSVDLTGGFDSRLVATMLAHHGASFETSLSGISTMKDAIIGKRVAELLGRPYFLSTPDQHHLDLAEAFTLADGQFDVLTAHTIAGYQQDRAERGTTMVLSGICGEMFSDHLWLQDFPFYVRNRSNLSRLYNMRLAPLAPPNEVLSNPMVAACESLKERTLSKLTQYVRSINTQTYDEIFYDVVTSKKGGPILSRIASRYHAVYAPYIEPSVSRVGYAMARRRRVFSWHHRTLISKVNPAVSRLLTTEHITASTRPTDLVFDVGRYVYNKSRRLAKTLTQRTLGKTIFGAPGRDKNWEYRIARLPEVESLFDILHTSGIIKPKISPPDVPGRLLGRFLSLADVARRLK